MGEGLLEFVLGEPLAIVPRVTAVLFLAYPPWRQWEPAGTVAELYGLLYRGALVIGLCSDRIVTHPGFWSAVGVVHWLWIGRAYAVADNHRYLEGYWCLALAMALYVGDDVGETVLSRTSVWLIASCFGCAVLGKIFSRSYRNGSFFTHSLIFDPRFLPIASVLGRLGRELRVKHHEAARRIAAGDSIEERVEVPTSLRRLSLVLTWWTIWIETAVVVACLVPMDGMETLRAVIVGIFVLTTYLFVPVVSFGNVLLVMLLASVGDPYVRGAVLAILLAVPIGSFVSSRLAARGTELLAET
jgi:hypothetical protein